MAIEERGLVVSGCQDVPKSSRIMLMNQTFDAQTCITHLQLKRAPWNDAVPLEEEMISWRTNHVSSEILTPELTSKKILRVAGLHYSLSLFRGRFRITHSFYEQLRLIWQYWLSSGKDRDLEQRCFLGIALHCSFAANTKTGELTDNRQRSKSTWSRIVMSAGIQVYYNYSL